MLSDDEEEYQRRIPLPPVQSVPPNVTINAGVGTGMDMS